MKISYDDSALFTVSDTQKQVMCNDIPSEVFDAEMKRRIHYIVNHKYNQCMERLKREWTPKLKALGITSIPLDDDAFAALVFARPEYKSRSQRMSDEEKRIAIAQSNKALESIK